MSKGKVCSWCRSELEVKNEVESVFHKHNNSHKIQKHIKFVGHFKSVDEGKKPDLCLKCQIKVLRGMYVGGNWS